MSKLDAQGPLNNMTEPYDPNPGWWNLFHRCIRSCQGGDRSLTLAEIKCAESLYNAGNDPFEAAAVIAVAAGMGNP